MGYGSHVVCNCYREGLATEPPHKQYVRIDEEDGSIYIDTDHLKDPEERLKWWLEFDEWRLTACSHDDMDYASERLANMSGMAAFRQVIAEFGGVDRFPILTAYLPTANGGLLPTSHTAAALREVGLLRQEKTEQKIVVLQENFSGDIIASTSVSQSLTFVQSANFPNYALSADGFFIFKPKEYFWERNKILFHSIKFKQVKSGNSKFRFVDLNTGATCDDMIKIYPFEAEVSEEYIFSVTIQQAHLGDEYKYIIDPLTIVLQASLETGNPVAWL